MCSPRLLAALLLTMLSPSITHAAATATDLTVGAGAIEPLGFHDATPTFSWKLPPGVEKQTAYSIEVRGNGLNWDSGWIESDASVLVPYGGPPLTSRQQVTWRVQFRDEKGDTFPWSPDASLEMGLLSAADWQAQWIRPQTNTVLKNEPVCWLRRDFSATGTIERARLYVTARGLFEVRLNGVKVGNDHFANGWTVYDEQLDTVTYDVTDEMTAGDNAIGAMLGTGWYAGRLGWKHQEALYGRRPELLLQLELQYQDGSKETIISDPDWKATWDGPIRRSSFYDGETYDARMELSGWDRPGYDDVAWEDASADAALGLAVLTPKSFPPVRAIETVYSQTFSQLEPGRVIFDLGQNLVGWAKLILPMTAGQAVTLRFAEMLNPDGTMHTENYRSAESTDRYTAAADGLVQWEPTFSFHGFRYVELSGLPADAKPELDWVRGIVLHSDLRPLGTFTSSHDKLNQLQRNIVWGQRGNFLDIPTDCPQRDERLGWTGDAQVFCPTAMFNYDTHSFWKSWLGSMRRDQMADGRIPHIIPDVLGDGVSPGWMDAATIIPWEVYQRTGDLELLAENLQMMEKLVGWYRSQATNSLIEEIGGFGDWLQPYASTGGGETPRPLLGTAFYAHSAELLAKSAERLSQPEKAKQYAAEAESVKKAFARHYLAKDGRLQNAPETQTGYLLTLAFRLVPDDLRAKVVPHLLRLLDDANGHLRTGFLGTPYIVRVLDEVGHTDKALGVLFQDSYPSWFYSIDQGATTIWERWDSYSRADGFSNESMNSLNHYAYGAIGQWLYERIAGLAPDPANPGYKHFFIRPVIAPQLDWAKVELETAYGTASSGWKRTDESVALTITVPPNTTATIHVPDGRDPVTVSAGEHRFEW